MYQQENFESRRVAKCLGLQPLYAGDRDCIVAIDGPPLEEFCDVSQGGLAKISLMSRKGVSERISYMHLTSNSEYQNVLATERHQKNMLGFFHF